MAKLEKVLSGDFDSILDALHQAILSGSLSATYEEGSDFQQGEFRCAVRVYERYSFMGGNRVSLNLTLVGGQGRCYLSCITSGGSQGVVMKLNTWGEEAFLDTIRQTVEGLD